MTLEAAERMTPVRSWLPTIAGTSSPSTALDYETLISSDAASVLTARRDIGASGMEATVVSSDKPGTEEPWLIMTGAGYAAAVKVGERVVRYVMSEPPAGAPSDSLPSPRLTFDELTALLASIQDGLGLYLTEVSKLVGLPRTTLYRAKRRAGASVNDRLFNVATRAEFLSSLMLESRTATEGLLRGRFEDVRTLLESGDFISARNLFIEAKRQMVAAKSRPADTTFSRLADIAEETRGMLAQPAFAKAVELVVGLNPYAGEVEIERAKAFADLDDALTTAGRGETVPESWDFLLTIRKDERHEVRRRAFDFIRSDEFGGRPWADFVARESEAAWGRYRLNILPALGESLDAADEEVPPMKWDIDLSDIAIDESFYDRRSR